MRKVSGEEVALELSEGRMRAALRDDVDRAGPDVSDRRIAGARRDLEVRRTVEDQRVGELVREGVGVVDPFVLEAFLVFTAAAENRVAAGVKGGCLLYTS